MTLTLDLKFYLQIERGYIFSKVLQNQKLCSVSFVSQYTLKDELGTYPSGEQPLYAPEHAVKSH